MKVGLVLEGGSYKGLFSAGVLDTFMDEGIHIDCDIGVSAGALFSPNYFSKQKGRVLRYAKRFCKDPRNMSLWSYLFTGNIVNKQFAFYDVTLKYDIFDNETFIKNNTGFYATATNVETGEAEYLEMKDILGDMEMLRATSAIPFFSKFVEVNGKYYLDGGIAESVPIRHVQTMGYDKIIVVLTRPYGEKKYELSKIMEYGLRLKYRKYPKLLQTFLHMYEHYNETLDYVNALENRGEIFVFRPYEKIPVSTVERDPNNLQKAYDMGVCCCKDNLEALRDFLNIKR